MGKAGILRASLEVAGAAMQAPQHYGRPDHRQRKRSRYKELAFDRCNDRRSAKGDHDNHPGAIFDRIAAKDPLFERERARRTVAGFAESCLGRCIEP